MSNPQFLNIPPKKQLSCRVDESLYNSFVSYANAMGLNMTETMTEILKEFFNENRIVSNTYLDNLGAIKFNIPLDLDLKMECINNRTNLNENNNFTGETASLKVEKIPNNLDLFVDCEMGKTYKSDGEDILHKGIDFVTIKDVIKKPTTMLKDKININIMDCLYCFLFEVKADYTINVYLIDNLTAINELSKVNNRIIGDKLIEVTEQLEDLINYNNDSFKRSIANLHDGKSYVSNKAEWEILDSHLLDIEMYFPSYENKNIKIKTSAPIQ